MPTILQLEKFLREEIQRAKADADMSTATEDLEYHNGEYDAYKVALDALLGEWQI